MLMMPSAPSVPARMAGGERRPHAWLTVCALALSVAPMRALRGLWWLLRGKRVRGWNMLYVAAADHPSYYRRWVQHGEPRVVRAFLAERTPGATPPSIGCLILGNDAAAIRTTLESVRAALGDAAPVWTGATAASGSGVAAMRLQEAFGTFDSTLAWLLPLRAGDTVSPTLGAVLRRALPNANLATIVFWDEDTQRDGRRSDPWVKPQWDPILFGARDGLTGAALIAAPAARAAARRHPDAQCDADGVALLVSDILTGKGADALHLPLILTHRAERIRFSAAPVATVESTAWPCVSLIIPTRDRADLLETCLAGLARLTYPGEIELLIVDNDSVEPATHALFERVIGEGAIVLPHPGGFNYAALINQAAGVASGDVLCLLNNDVELLDGDWLTHMVRYAVRENVGAVGACLLFPNGAVQHAGVAIGVGGAAGHVQKGADPADPHFAEWHAHTRIVSAVTGACLVVKRASFEAAGGMDAVGFAVDFNDVDFCLRLQTLGLSNVIVVEATLIHQESESRGSAPQEEDGRFAAELALLRARWKTVDYDDPCYSPLFRRECERCVLAF